MLEHRIEIPYDLDHSLDSVPDSIHPSGTESEAAALLSSGTQPLLQECELQRGSQHSSRFRLQYSGMQVPHEQNQKRHQHVHNSGGPRNLTAMATFTTINSTMTL